jgi:hypothetical protein
MATLAEMLRQGADRLIDLPNDARRFMTNPQAFTQLVTGKNPMPRETGFAAGATGLPPTETSVLNPNDMQYMTGYEQGEPFGIAAMALPLAAPAAVATAKALAPKAGQMAENFMVRQGFMPNIVPPSPTNQLGSAVDVSKITNPTAKALLSAQKQAELPVSEGGLGLGKNNTPAERAAAQGYIDYYHGTERLDRLLEGNTLNPKRATSGPMAFGTDNPNVASNYAIGKQDTSRISNDTGDFANYFQVSPKDLGFTRSRTPYSVEQTWYLLSPEKKAEILDKAKRVGYENLDEYSGNFITHQAGTKGMPISEDTWKYYLERESQGNPLTALRKIWAESGNLGPYDQSKLADIYKLAGYPYQISQSNAPWSSAKGVLLGKARITNPLVTENADELKSTVLPALQKAFANDRTRPKSGGADQWDKNTRYTPKEWVSTLAKDLEEGANSYVWTSIPDKVTAELKKLGYNGIIDTGGKGGSTGHQVVIPFDPSQVRSRFAAFNPKNVDKPNLLAGGLAVPIVDEDNRKAMLEKLFNNQ